MIGGGHGSSVEIAAHISVRMTLAPCRARSASPTTAALHLVPDRYHDDSYETAPSIFELTSRRRCRSHQHQRAIISPSARHWPYLAYTLSCSWWSFVGVFSGVGLSLLRL